MNVLDYSPLEALAFNYVSFGLFTVVNNLWTWVAVLTAAVSFWRISASGCLKPHPTPPCSSRSSNGSLAVSELSPPDTVTEPPVSCSGGSASAPAQASTICGMNDEGVTKGKFTVYYGDDREGEGEGDVAVAGEWESGGGEWWESWERVLRMKQGEMGWYRYQDLTELNGNVVRLWDGCRGQGRYKSSCVVW